MAESLRADGDVGRAEGKRCRAEGVGEAHAQGMPADAGPHDHAHGLVVDAGERAGARESVVRECREGARAAGAVQQGASARGTAATGGAVLLLGGSPCGDPVLLGERGEGGE